MTTGRRLSTAVMDSETHDSAELEHRLELILAEQSAWLRRTAHRLCPRHLGVQAEEIEQEVRLRLWRALERENDLRSPTSYLHRIATTATIDAIRRVQARREESLEIESSEDGLPIERPVVNDPAPDPFDRAAQRDVLAAVERCIEELPENRKLAVKLHLQGFNYREIGGFLDWTEAKARNLVSRGMKSLRDQLHTRGVHHADAIV